MEFCWVLPVDVQEGAEAEYSLSIKESIEAEKFGFHQVLISSLQKALDPWVLASLISVRTNKIRMLVAQNSNFTLPTVTAKSANSLSIVVNGRIDINIVTGSSVAELAKDVVPLSHQERYKRTAEYTDVLQRLYNETLTFESSYYSIKNAAIYPQANKPRLFIAGSSEQASLVAAKSGDVHMMYAADIKTVRKVFERTKIMAREHKRSVKCGVYVDLIARETREEAWAVAGKLLQDASPIEKKKNKLFYSGIDSVGHLQNKEFALSKEQKLDHNLWTGRSQISSGTSVSIVGSYEEVSKTIQTFHEAGADFFIITASGMDNEIQRIGEHILPNFKVKSAV
ncbi:LLM class flavin-dependent oxidoreductase [Bacillus subtilis]|uniref:LLM class flavin-dependent oxidoreductase n=1 Tax=Bacillus subtilis TaxID=1423 RepID=UPI000B44E6EF|nr:LLM class flavin-dependent oxidoreductase [Bacillus subtilis]MDH3120351.1 LLM class flavin-dependent oxidoreductase [Bacillus subtilis]OTQ83612.1 hypothetical protein BG30_16225 [Bacillus subtilis subsp. subtilis]